MMRRFAACLGLLGLLLVSVKAEGAPRRIVSLNLCADQYLIALADPAQVAALTQHARDPSLSYFASEAERYPMTAAAAEAVMTLDPDLIIGNPYESAEVRALLRRFNYPILELPPADNFSDIVRQTQLIAEAIGHPDRGIRLIETMRLRLAAIPPVAGTRRPVAVHYQRRGYVTGTETLLHEIMVRAGLANLAAQFGDRTLARVPLERIVSAAPDYLLYTTDIRQATDQGTELLLHPVLARQFGPARILYVPEALTVCGGPSYPAAVEALGAQLRGRPPRPSLPKTRSSR